ncbi:uncharacterized protein B0P05DRAFT_538523 [Gilbertella persicaria]|uniref:uncharacterized protein n=1 Tax=Gilbertella persicaria TaxID=101096 RepID=UPI00221F095E|nr:uncharacterized protein B0P05DRAFT_538523 [Gilbertella persicaria]KAI8081898.1 hypothetical protein B0P05DRAFT_538523 [Gilbertella persicaria]
MSNYLKELKTKLQKMEEGYPHQWKLIKETYIPEPKEEINHSLEFYDKITRQTTKPLCQNIDLIVPSENRTQSQQIQLEQFLNIIGTKLDKQRSFIQETQEPIQDTLITKKFIRNDEKRHFRIQEFIKTERSYVDTLQTIVKHVVRPLRANMNQKTAILNTFKCQKIFLNIDQIAIVNKDFLADLDSMNDNFGELCSKHIIKFECYRKYLLEQAEAQKLHAKEFKVNQNYRRFLVKVKDHADFKRKRLQDILVEPVQRISRYSMMLRDILQLTPEDHHDYQGLKAACEKAREIATMADDDPTKTATMFLNLYQSIKDSPCSLINQKRSFIAHLDAIEIHRVTNKPTRAVTIFLFTDKILVASRSSIDAKGIDIQQILEYSNPMSPTSLFSGNNKDNRADKHQLRFKGWADIESIEMFEGVPERPGSFILSATNIPEIHRDEMSNLTSFEKYFYKGPRLYSVIPQKDEMSSRLKRTEYVEKSVEFRTVYQKTRALMKQYDVPENKVYHKLWKGTFTFCNIYYSQESYLDAKYKNDFALIYVDNDQIQLETLFPSQSSLYHPWVIGLVQPEEMKGFRFNICSKLRFSSSTTHTDPTIDFESIFWNNLLYLNQCLKQSNEYLTQTIVKVQQSVLNNSQQQQRSRSKSISRTSSIPSIGKLFHSNGSTSRSRSVSPSKMIKKSKSASYSATSNRASVHYASWSEQYYKSESQASSLATLNSSLSSSSGHLPQDTEYTYDQKELPLDIVSHTKYCSILTC